MERVQQRIADGLLYRNMSAGDIPAGLRLCRAARWNQVERDWRVFLERSPNGCHVAERDGNIVGTTATLRFGGRFSWISMVLVDPVERGAGIGTRLIEAALDALRDELCVRLDATPAGLSLYMRHGFVEEYPIVRVTTTVYRALLAELHVDVRPMRERDFEAVLPLDAVAFGADRGFLLRDLFQRAPEYAWVAVEGSNITGFTFGRPGFLYSHLGPVVARNRETACALVGACLAGSCATKVGIDVPRLDVSWLEWLEQRGFVQERSLLRMFRGENRYPGQASDVYAIAGPEFG